jgi:hypothetical protein
LSIDVPADLERFLPDEAWFRFRPLGIHGAPHTTRVLVWAAVLADRIGRPDALRRDELLWAAAVHDVGRNDDGTDCGHGRRSADWVLAELARQRPAAVDCDLGFVAELCTWHEISDDEIERISLELLILKDADGLDRVRLGDLDPERLRFQSGRRLVDAAERLERATNAYDRISAAEVLVRARRVLD